MEATVISDYGLAFTAVVVSILGLLVTVVISARTAAGSRVSRLERELAECRRMRKELEDELERLRDRELDLMRRLLVRPAE